MRMSISTAFIIILTVASLITAFVAGGNYSRGYIAGYKAALQKHKVTLDSLSEEYKKTTKEYEEATYWCNKIRDLYQAQLDSPTTVNIHDTPNPKKQ